jgi:hypothetical protein
MLSDYVCSTSVTLLEITATAPAYALNSVVTRFPTGAFQGALLSQVRQIVPLISIFVFVCNL